MLKFFWGLEEHLAHVGLKAEVHRAIFIFFIFTFHFLIVMAMAQMLPHDLNMERRSHDNRWLHMDGDGTLCLCSKVVRGVRSEHPPWSRSLVMSRWCLHHRRCRGLLSLGRTSRDLKVLNDLWSRVWVLVTRRLWPRGGSLGHPVDSAAFTNPSQQMD